MVDALSPLVDPVFTPPWNRCTEVTAGVLVASGIPVLSRDVTATPLGHPDLIEVPVTLDCFGGRKGVRWTQDELATRLAADLRSGGPVGIMLHHAVSDATEREAIDEVVRLVSAHPAARTSTISESAAEPRLRPSTTAVRVAAGGSSSPRRS